jgi:hypothetical protein
VAIFSAASTPGEISAAPPPEIWPDLVQLTPSDLGVRGRDGRFQLGFESAVENHGPGRLIVRGTRSARQPEMTADQLIDRTDGSRARVRNIGRIRYTYSGGHDHWHYLLFDRYELRRASDHRLVRPDRKTGFCLGDRYDPGRTLPGKPGRPVLTGACLKNQPRALNVLQGISVGYGDDYPPYLEGQSIDITGLPAGDYELVHRVNGDRRVRESTYSNNASSLHVRIDWPRGNDRRPEVDRLKICPQRERCVR